MNQKLVFAVDLAALVESLLESGEGEVYDKVITEVERVLLPQVLRHTHGPGSGQ
jgi:hypothetical protein